MSLHPIKGGLDYRRFAWLVAVPAALVLGVWLLARPNATERLSLQIQRDVADIRGLSFRRAVLVEETSDARFEEYLRGEVARRPTFEHFWPVARATGIYRGPDLGPPDEIYIEALMSGAAGVYDARTGTMMLMTGQGLDERKVVLAHELNHALQDQHFDLQRYVVDLADRDDANEDEVLAHVSVVEGEAAYVDTIYQARAYGMTNPTRQQIAELAAAHVEWDPDSWQPMLEQPELDDGTREWLQTMIELRERMPPFMLDELLAPYSVGIGFIHALRERDWSHVDTAYRAYPPVSTEQVLHPEKWFAREAPVALAWPAFDAEPALTGWKLLHENVLGERRWQSVFRAQDRAAEAEEAAAGWNGDRFAVFEHEMSGDTLFLLATAWDTPEDATEFAAAYRRALATKHAANPVPVRLREDGNRVWVVEGGTEESIDALMAFNRRALR